MKNLKSLRESKGLSQQRLASYFNLSQQSIYKYENGLAEPDIATLEAMADFFDTSVDYLVGHSDIPYKLEERNDCALSQEEQSHMEAYRKLSPSLRSLLNTLIGEYLKN